MTVSRRYQVQWQMYSQVQHNIFGVGDDEEEEEEKKKEGPSHTNIVSFH